MVHVRFGSRPPSWPQNEVKVLVDAESSLYSSSIETPGPARPWRENVLRPRSPAGLPRLYPFWSFPRICSLCCVYQPLIPFCSSATGMLSRAQSRRFAAWGARCTCPMLSAFWTALPARAPLHGTGDISNDTPQRRIQLNLESSRANGMSNPVWSLPVSFLGHPPDPVS